MDYRNLESIEKTISSYSEALQKLLAICPKLYPSGNEYNQRVVLPTSWRPAFGADTARLLPYANHLVVVEFRRLITFPDRPEHTTKEHRLWREDFFSVRWEIRVPFSIYSWEVGRQSYTDDKDVQHKAVPDTMEPWCSPQYLTIADNPYTGKSWGLKDWYSKHNEIKNYLNNTQISEKQQESYAKEIAEADVEIVKWQKIMGNTLQMTELLRPPT